MNKRPCDWCKRMISFFEVVCGDCYVGDFCSRQCYEKAIRRWRLWNLIYYGVEKAAELEARRIKAIEDYNRLYG